MVSVLFWFAVMQPMLTYQAEHAELRQQLSVQQQLADQSERRVQLISRQLDQVNGQITDQPIQLKGNDQLNQVLDDLASLVQDCGLQVDQIQPGRVRKQQYFHTLDMRFEGVGTYPRFAALLHRLHDACPDIRIHGFDLTSADWQGGSARYKLDLLWHMRGEASGRQTATTVAPDGPNQLSRQATAQSRSNVRTRSEGR